MTRYGLVSLLFVLLTLWAAGQPVEVRGQASITHKVQAGENLFRIALYYGTTVDAIRNANGMDTVYIYVGQQLVIPDVTDVAPPTEPLTPPPENAAPGAPTPVPTPAMADLDARTYVVQAGDTLGVIAVRLGVSTWALMQENGLTSWSVIYVGQELVVPVPSRPEGGDDRATLEPEPAVASMPPPEPTDTPSVTEPPTPVDAETYTVRRGDTLTQIAARFGTTVAAISRLNGIANPSQIYVGQVLRLKGTAPAPSGVGQLIIVNLSEQHLYAYQGDQLVYSFVASTGAAPYYTRAGEFRIQSKISSAYGSTWNIWMPYWMGIYWAGSTENGIHALPVMSNGQVLWAGYLGSPVSYGCVVLGTQEAKLLYDWAKIGTPVSIRY
ncbi:MAG: LysM peptidoglycan-binding domain-containing protein [Anaerolineae bacterium]